MGGWYRHDCSFSCSLRCVPLDKKEYLKSYMQQKNPHQINGGGYARVICGDYEIAGTHTYLTASRKTVRDCQLILSACTPLINQSDIPVVPSGGCVK